MRSLITIFFVITIAGCGATTSASETVHSSLSLERVFALENMLACDDRASLRAGAYDYERYNKYVDAYRSHQREVRDRKGTVNSVSLPSWDALMGRTAIIANAVLDDDYYDSIPLGYRGRLYAWYWGYIGRVMNLAYSDTKNLDFLDLAISGFDILIKNQDYHFPSHNLGGAGWATETKSGQFKEITAQGLTVLPALQLLFLAADDQTIACRIGAERAKYWVDQASSALLQFQDTLQTYEDTIYFVEPFPPSNIEAWNHMSVYGASLVYLNEIKPTPETKRLVDGLASFFKRSKQLNHDGSAFWAYAPDPYKNFSGKGETFWKAVPSVEMFFALHEVGYELDFPKEQIFSIPHSLFVDEPRRALQSGNAAPIGVDTVPLSLANTALYFFSFSCEEPSSGLAVKKLIENHPVFFENGFLGSNISRIGLLGLAYWKMNKHCIQA